MWLRELKPGLCDNLEGWDGVGGGRKAQEGGDIYIYIYIYTHTHTYDCSMLMYGRNQHNIIIILQLKIKKKKNVVNTQQPDRKGAVE